MKSRKISLDFVTNNGKWQGKGPIRKLNHWVKASFATSYSIKIQIKIVKSMDTLKFFLKN